MLTLTQRLAAGAMGLPFFPTRSLAGSSLADNLADFTLLKILLPVNRSAW